VGLTQHGEAGAIVVPVFAAIAAGILWRLAKVTKGFQRTPRRFIYLGVCATLTYLGLNAFLATLQEWHLAFTPNTTATAAAIGWGGLALFILALFLWEQRALLGISRKPSYLHP
jgi:hypothetical protein